MPADDNKRPISEDEENPDSGSVKKVKTEDEATVNTDDGEEAGDDSEPTASSSNAESEDEDDDEWDDEAVTEDEDDDGAGDEDDQAGDDGDNEIEDIDDGSTGTWAQWTKAREACLKAEKAKIRAFLLMQIALSHHENMAWVWQATLKEERPDRSLLNALNIVVEGETGMKKADAIHKDAVAYWDKCCTAYDKTQKVAEGLCRNHFNLDISFAMKLDEAQQPASAASQSNLDALVNQFGDVDEDFNAIHKRLSAAIGDVLSAVNVAAAAGVAAE
ncbi:hypothetical protein Q8F55_004086 [Vanrija albida]|uniref:Uncharacterized protein n=1 Tax=Vanrija albida TaxID=181172 RepID=A0ABR3Q5Z9_9TREE